MHNSISKKRIVFHDEAIKNAKETILNSPILGRVVFDSDKIPDFAGHDMHVEKDSNEKSRIIYDEIPIGLIPETSNYEVSVDDNNISYVFVDAYIWKGYSNYAEDIILRRKDVSISMEVDYTDVKYDEKEKIYNVYGYKYTGITMLGENYTPAMQGAKAKIANKFNINNEEIFTLEQLKTSLMEIFSENIEKETKGGFELKNSKKEEVVEVATGELLDKDEPQNNTKEIDNIFEVTYKNLRDMAYLAVEKISPKGGHSYFVDISDIYIYVCEVTYETPNKPNESIYRYTYTNNKTELAINVESKTQVIKQFITLEESEKIDSDKEELRVLKSEKEALKKEITENKKTEIFDSFDEKLQANQEYTDLKNKASDFSAEDIETKCFAILGKQQFCNEEIKVVKKKVDSPQTESKHLTKYGRHLEEFYEKNKR